MPFSTIEKGQCRENIISNISYSQYITSSSTGEPKPSVHYSYRQGFCPATPPVFSGQREYDTTKFCVCQVFFSIFLIFLKIVENHFTFISVVISLIYAVISSRLRLSKFLRFTVIIFPSGRIVGIEMSIFSKVNDL